jgi:hypothetical protein
MPGIVDTDQYNYLSKSNMEMDTPKKGNSCYVLIKIVA